MKSLSKDRFDWFVPLTTLKGVGEALTEKFTKLDIYCVGDLLLHFPYRYEDHTRLTPMSDLRDGQNAVVQGNIVSVHYIGRQKKRCHITLADSTGYCELVFFHTFKTQNAIWKNGTILRCFGQAKLNTKGFQIVHPEWERIADSQVNAMPTHLTPIYPTVAGFAQKTLRKVIFQALAWYQACAISTEDILTEKLATFAINLSCKEALLLIHQPAPDEDQHLLTQRTHRAYRRLIAEELLTHYISMQKIKEKTLAKSAPALPLDEKALQDFLKRLPFELTTAQQSAWQAIREDLAKGKPMLRLVQGDVGCGKTVVAALAALTAVTQGRQVAVMVPTEILAEQHFVQFQAWFAPLNVQCALLTGKLKAKERRSIEENIALGLSQIVIGTHALFQERVNYASLGLIIIDEQHRFGVHQRLALREKGNVEETSGVHQLIMTATPIPRTLAMSQYAHLDISTISSLPPGRQPIKTIAISQSRRDEVIERIKSVCAKGQQVYWVCTLIAESEHLQCQTAENTYELLSEQLSDFQVGLVHGRLSAEEKDQIMQAFYRAEIQILVATTVIEVGVNVPNATLMIIENPERLGLAQLHQLRGRVGRGQEMSFCVLLYQPPLSEMAQSRLGILRESQDGFVIAEADLELRGPGEILGTKQTGEIGFRVADLNRDQDLIHKISEWENTFSDLPEYFIDELIKRWLTSREYVYS